MMLRWLLFLSSLSLPVLALSGCQLGRHWDDGEQTLYVDFYKVPCDNDATTLCFRIRENTADGWKTWTDSFTGFSSYQWGYSYRITVVTSFDDDGDPQSYSFSSIDEQTAVTSDEDSFTLNLYTSSGILQQLDDATFSLAGDGDEKDFACGEYCSDLATILAAREIAKVEFSVSDDAVTVSSIICTAVDDDDFSSHCEETSEESWIVAHFQTDCGLPEPQLCLLFKVNSSDDYELLRLADGIDGFSPQWGYRYDIDVTKTVSNGGNITAVTLDTDDSSPDERFSSSYTFLFILRGSGLDNSSGGYIDLYDSSLSLNCSSYSLCTKMNDYIDDDQYLLLKGYVDSDSEIMLTKIVCHDDSHTDFQRCVAGEDEDEDINWSI